MPTKKKAVGLPTADGVPVHCAFDEILAIDKLKPYPRNSNAHPQEQVRIVAKLINGHGWRVPITVSNQSGFIVRGHCRLESAKLMGVSSVPVDYQDYESEEKERADRIADQRSNELSHFDRDILRGELEDLDSGILDDMELTGFDSEALEELFTAAPPESTSSGENGGDNQTEEDGPSYKVVVICETEEERDKIVKYIKRKGHKYKVY